MNFFVSFHTGLTRRLLFWLPFLLIGIIWNLDISFTVYEMFNQTLALFLAYVCSFPFFMVLFLVGACVWFSEQRRFVLSLLIGFLVAVWLGIILKNSFLIERPYIIYDLVTIVPASGFSFPSLHTIAVFSLLPIMQVVYKKASMYWFIFCLLIAFARVYLHVHTVADVFFGAFVGYEISTFFVLLEKKHDLYARLQKAFFSQLEARRQIVHLLFGVALVFFYKAYLLTADTLLICTVLAGIAFFLLKKKKLPWLYRALSFFERQRHLEKFPGRGIFFFLVGSWLSFLFFADQIALAAIIILAFGDSITNIFGRYFGKKKIFYNPKKNWEGTLMGILFGTIGATYFVPFFPAFVATMIALLVETCDLKVGKFEIDDNVTIPLVAGIILTLML